MPKGDPLVTANWLQQNLASADLQVIDATWVPPFLKDRLPGHALYAQGHIPGAVFFDIDEIAAPKTDLPHMLPDPAQFADQVGQLGISNDSQLIVYDSNGFYASARVWWMFHTMGHEAIHVLDGGLAAWQRTGGQKETRATTPKVKTFTPAQKPHLVANMQQVRQSSQAKTPPIFDARAEGRFSGTAPEPRADLPSGHIPASLSLPASELLKPDGTLKSASDLGTLLSAYSEQPAIATCGSGVSAAIIALARARLGDWDTAIYDGSWTEWASHANNAIASV